MSVKPILIIVCLLFATSCLDKGPGTIKPMPGAAPPTFEISGTGDVQWVWFQGPYQNLTEPGPKLEFESKPDSHILWKIAPTNGRFLPIADIPKITYGELPTGWQQEIPKTGPPPAWLDGYVYYIGIVPQRGSGAELCVFLKNGQMQPYRDDSQKWLCGKGSSN